MNAAQIIKAMDSSIKLNEIDFEQLQKQFEVNYFDTIQYFQSLAVHRYPNNYKNEILISLNQELINIQQRPEMRDNDEVRRIAGFVPGYVKEIWIADKRIRSCYDAIMIYCGQRPADTNVILVHMAEYKALYIVYRKI